MMDRPQGELGAPHPPSSVSQAGWELGKSAKDPNNTVKQPDLMDIYKKLKQW